MSLLPDFSKIAQKHPGVFREVENAAIQQQPIVEISTQDIADLQSVIKYFMNNFADSDAHKLYKTSRITFKMSHNVRDSVTFLEKFIHLYFESLQKTLPNKDFKAFEETFKVVQKSLAEYLNRDNVENLYLLPILLGAIDAILSYNNHNC